MKNRKKILILTGLALFVVAAIFTSLASKDIQGAVRTKINPPPHATTEGPSMTTGQITTQAPGAATITRESYSGWNIRAISMLDTPIPPGSAGGGGSPVNLLGTASCSESNYQPMGMWKMVVENRSLSLNMFK